MKNFTERRKDGPKVRGAFENFAAGETAKAGRRVAPREEGVCPAFGDRRSGPELIVYIIRPFFFCLGEQRGHTVAFPMPPVFCFSTGTVLFENPGVRFAHMVRGGTFASSSGVNEGRKFEMRNSRFEMIQTPNCGLRPS